MMKHPQIEIYENLLIDAFHPSHIEIIDDSHQHAGHAGHSHEGASHLTLHMVSEKFTGLNRVARHRLVYDVLKSWMQTHIHALVINAKSPNE